MTLYWMDTEFIEDGKTIDLISIGIICEDGREYYALNYDCDYRKASDWVKKNVLRFLPEQPLPQIYKTAEDYQASKSYKQGWRNREVIANEILDFVGWRKEFPHFFRDEDSPEFWTYYGAYDWVVFCQLWGKMIDLPKGFPMYCNDVKQLTESMGNPRLPKQKEGEHHALNDARWVREAWQFLVNNKLEAYK